MTLIASDPYDRLKLLDAKCAARSTAEVKGVTLFDGGGINRQW